MDDGNEPGSVRGGGEGWRSGDPGRPGLYLRDYRNDGYLWCRWSGYWWYCGHADKYRAIAEMEPSVEQDLRWREEADAVKED